MRKEIESDSGLRDAGLTTFVAIIPYNNMYNYIDNKQKLWYILNR